jgi:hypothetical protein
LVLGRRLKVLLCKARENIMVRGYQFVMASFTVDRKRFESPEVARLAIDGGREVYKAVGAWCQRWGIQSRGRWLKRFELQEGGWPHWHVLVAVPRTMRPFFSMPKRGPDGVPRGGEFDDVWKFGYSNLQVVDAAERFDSYVSSSPGSRFTRYACKDAGREGPEALERAGLPPLGVHWVSPAKGFWAWCGVEAFDARLLSEPEWPDELQADDDGACGVVVERGRRARWVSHADRVRSCGLSSYLVVEGGMRDEREPGERVGARGGGFGVRVPLTRKVLGMAAEEYAGLEACKLFDTRPGVDARVVEYFTVTPESLLGFLEFLSFAIAEPGWYVAARAFTLRRLGYAEMGSGTPLLSGAGLKHSAV